MDAKNYIKNKSFCTLPWTGFIVHQNGDVRNCVLSKSKIGNLKDNSIQEIVSGEKNNAIKKQFFEISLLYQMDRYKMQPAGLALYELEFFKSKKLGARNVQFATNKLPTVILRRACSI